MNELLYPIICDSEANIKNALDIWIKFTNYLKPNEEELINRLNNEKLMNISQEELEEYTRIKKQIDISNLFIKYKNKECNKEEHDKVIEFMKQPLIDFIESRLSKEEISISKSLISLLNSKKTLEDYINSKKEIDKLNIYESYIVYIAKEKLYNINNTELINRIKKEEKDRAVSLRKAIIRDYGIY